MFPLGPDKTEYYLLTPDYVSVEKCGDREILNIAPEALTVLAKQATHDNAFMLRREHNEMVAKILHDPEASNNDRYVALTMLRNAEISAKGELPFCQDTGTAICIGKKGQNVYTGGHDEEYISAGVYQTYTECNLRYSQNAPLNMYDEVNTGCNLPAQIDLYATDGDEYKFVFVAKGGGSANKTYLYQETKAIINPKTLVPFLVEKMKSLGTAACPPYHIAFVIGGTSAEVNLATVKKASIKYYDWIEKLDSNPGELIPEDMRNQGEGDVVRIDLDRPMDEILKTLSQYPVATRLSLNGTIIVGRDIAHAKIKERLDNGEPMPQYLKDHPIYYAGPAKTPAGMASGSFGPTTAGRMDPYVDLFQDHGGSMIMIAKGNRSQQVTDACKKHGGFYLGSIGGPAAILAHDSIKSVELLEYPELGMEAIWKIKVENFPAFILVDDKGNDFFKEISAKCAACPIAKK